MAEGIPARLTPAEGRKFGLTVGIAFLIFGGISRWRGHDTAPYVLWTIGGLLTGAGLLMPAQLGPIQRGWMRFGLALSKVTTPIFMGLIYYVVLTPTGFLMRLFGRNPLTHRLQGSGFWAKHETRADQTRSMLRQF